jgi:hypothetical protein
MLQHFYKVFVGLMFVSACAQKRKIIQAKFYQGQEGRDTFFLRVQKDG